MLIRYRFLLYVIFVCINFVVDFVIIGVLLVKGLFFLVVLLCIWRVNDLLFGQNQQKCLEVGDCDLDLQGMVYVCDLSVFVDVNDIYRLNVDVRKLRLNFICDGLVLYLCGEIVFLV